MRFLILAMMLLSGCAAHYTWVKDGGTQAAYERDNAQCYQEAASAAAVDSFGFVYRCCDRWELARDMHIETESRQIEFRQACMQARGYRMQAVRPSGG